MKGFHLINNMYILITSFFLLEVNNRGVELSIVKGSKYIHFSDVKLFKV